MVMGFFRSLDISASGLTAQRMRMDVIAENIANVSTTRTAAGGAYRRRYTEFEQIGSPSFSSYLTDSMGSDAPAGSGVRVSAIKDDMSDLKRVFDPTNPDADATGYVSMPNVDLAQEMVDMISATRAYEANVTALNAMKDLANKALEIGK
jgi:flagellar basal-body rod protein FlgC